MKKNKIYIVIVNYNGWIDTIECLESVLKLDYPDFQVIVCDNNSNNDSFNKMIEWANGKYIIKDSNLKKWVFPLENKPISYNIINNNNFMRKKEKVLFLQTEKNKGFAFANNCAIKYAIKQNDFSYIWLLNNDTVVCRNTLSLLVNYMNKNPNVGIGGTKLMEYFNPEKIQTLANSYNPIIGSGKHILKEKDLKNMSYVVGASMIVSKKFIEKIGLMKEIYFLYYEELDWTKRSEGLFDIGIDINSIVYHKGSSSIGGENCFSAFYSLRNRLLFTWYYYKKYFIIIFFRTLCAIFNPLKKRPYNRIKMLKNVFRDFYYKKDF